MAEALQTTPEPQPSSNNEGIPGLAADDLLNAFRIHYYRFQTSVQSLSSNSVDATRIAKLGDDLHEFLELVNEHSQIFDPAELQIINQNLMMMETDVRVAHEQELDRSHHGRPDIIRRVHTGGRGRPSVWIDPDFLRWAYTLRTTSGIARFLNLHRSTVRNALLEYGIAEPQENPFTHHALSRDLGAENSDPGLLAESLPEGLSNDVDDILDPVVDIGAGNNAVPARVVSFTGPISDIDDSELDRLIFTLRQHFTRAGIAMLDGMLKNLGLRVSRDRIRWSLVRIDPVHRTFDRIRIRRRTYKVAGPNALWHHDGQHGLIRWGIVIHGFIDGYSRLITALQANDNNRGETVLALFLRAAAVYGIPLRIRGDHGVENILLAAWMEEHMGERRGSYIWGRSVHNVRIERLWVDVTAQVTNHWHEAFTDLEMHHGLNINNTYHIWLLHHLFLAAINQQLAFFAESWNQHKIQIRNGPNRSPADMFGFDMLVHGIRGSQLPPAEEDMSLEELEIYGVDWAALRDDAVVASLQRNVPVQQEGDGSSWLGQVGPPPHLNEVALDPPEVTLEERQLGTLDQMIAEWATAAGSGFSIPGLWLFSLSAARAVYGDIF